MEEMFTFGGLYAEAWAISHTSVSLVKGITMVSPFFLMIFAYFGRGMFPSFFKEDLHRGRVFKKSLLFILIIIGIFLVKD
jgi:drug/metabolite transporter (DMT)-like permease